MAYYPAKFSGKLHENEENYEEKGEGVRNLTVDPPPSAVDPEFPRRGANLKFAEMKMKENVIGGWGRTSKFLLCRSATNYSST